jgi:hypothetical protein
MSDNDDFFDPDLDSKVTNDNTAEVIAAFKTLVKAEENAAILKAQLEGETATASKIKTATLPDLLKEMGTELWRDPETGITVELETAVNSALPKNVEKRNEILDALRPIGIEQIMAEEFTVNFAPNDKRAHAIRAILGLEPQTSVLEDDDDSEDYRLSNEQMDLVQRLRETFEFEDLPSAEKLGVHPSRLKSWLKTMIGKGHGNDIKEAGIWHGKHAKLTKPKEKN